MEEGLQNVFYIALAIVFWLGPALLKWWRKRAAQAPRPAAPARPRLAPAPAAVEEAPAPEPLPSRLVGASREAARALLREQRAHPVQGGVLALFDRAAAELFAPLAAHLERVGQRSLAVRIAVLEGEPEAAAALSDLDSGSVVVALPEGALDRPGAFALLAGATSRAALELWPGLLGEARRVLGLPDPEASAAYLAATGRITVPGLVSAWLPALLGDALGVARLGPPYAASLARAGGPGAEPEDALRIAVDGSFPGDEPPLHARMYVACLALDRLGRADEGGARWNAWNRSLENPGDFLLVADGAAAATIETGRILAALAPVVDVLLARSSAALGGFALAGIPGLALDEASAARIAEIAGALGAGEPVAAEPRLVLAAAALAAERPGQVESRIRKAALESLAGKRPASPSPAAARSRTTRAPVMDLGALLHTPGFAARAVALAAAVSPRRGGRSWV